MLCYVSITIIKLSLIFFFFFNDTATTEIYTLSLHDALPIYRTARCRPPGRGRGRRIRGSTVLRSEEHTSELQSQSNLVCRLLLEKKKKKNKNLRNTSDKKMQTKSRCVTIHHKVTMINV